MDKNEQVRKILGGAVSDNRSIREIIESTVVERPRVGYFRDMGRDVKEIGTDIVEAGKARGQKLYESEQGMKRGEQGMFRTALQAVGQTAGLASDIIGSTVKGIGKALLPQRAEEAVGAGVEAIGETVAQAEPVKAVADRYARLKQENPALARDISAALGIGELGLDVVLGGVGSKVAKPAIRAGGEAVETVAEQAPKVAKQALEKVTEPVKGVVSAPDIMNRVVRINPTDASKFSSLNNGATHGDYLVSRGIYGNPEDVAKQLYQRFEQSKGVVDEELSKITKKYRQKDVKQALDETRRRAIQTSPKSGRTPELRRLVELTNKYNKEGLTMSEINEIKRLYERTVRLDYVKSNSPTEVTRATNLDTSIREWQVNEATKQGFENLRELNKETQLSKELMNSIGKTAARGQGNNAVSLTDWIVLANGDPTAIATFGIKKVFSSESLQATMAKMLGGDPTIGVPAAKIGAPKPDLTDFLKKTDEM